MDCLVAMPGPSPDVPKSEFCASLGSVLLELRQDRGISRSQLARQSLISLGKMGQFERGDSYPDDETVRRLAAAFDIDLGELWSRACATYQERVQLREFLEILKIPRARWGEFFSLEPSARRAFVQAVQARIPSNSQRDSQLRVIESAIERDGLEASLDVILSGIAGLGFSPADYMRASVELEEMPGARAVFTDRLPLNPLPVSIDWLYLFRASYGVDPPTPSLLKWWAETRRSAMEASLEEQSSRTIVPVPEMERYIQTGRRGRNIVLPPDVVRAHLVATVELLRTQPHFQVGLTDSSLPIVYRIKGDHHVLVTVHGGVPDTDSTTSRTTLWFTRAPVVQRFVEHFDEAWSRLPPHRRERESVANWIEERLPDAGDGSRG